jgi:hypothetical protein
VTVTATPPPPPENAGTSTPTGAIVGGAVGGVAAIVGIAALALIFVRRGRRTQQGLVERSDSIPVGHRVSQVPKPEILPSSDVTEPPSPENEIPSARLRYPGE